MAMQPKARAPRVRVAPAIPARRLGKTVRFAIVKAAAHHRTRADVAVQATAIASLGIAPRPATAQRMYANRLNGTRLRPPSLKDNHIAAKSPDDYAKVYGRILSQAREPLIIHWLGEMFDPALKSYWGHADHIAAMDVCIDIIADNAAKVDGVKLSLLDKDKEIRMRRRLPQGVRTYTGDDFNFAELIAGDAQGYSDALLGIFDTIAPAASAALAPSS